MYLTGTDTRRRLPRPAARAEGGEGEGVGNTTLGNSTTAGPIAFKFGVEQLAITLLLHKSEYNCTCAPLFHI